MRTFAALVTGASGLLIARSAPEEQAVADPEATLKTLKAKRERLEAERAKLTAEAKDSGLTQYVADSSPESEMDKLHSHWKDSRQKSMAKKRELDAAPKKALDMLSGRFDNAGHEAVSKALGLLDQEPDRKSAAYAAQQRSGANTGDGATFVNAMHELNKMMLSVDDERINLMTECRNDLTAQWKMIWSHQDTVDAMDDQIKSNYQAADEKYEEMDVQSQEIVKREAVVYSTKDLMHNRMSGLYKTLEGLQADTNLYRFIMNIVEKNCTSMMVSAREKEKELMEERKRPVRPAMGPSATAAVDPKMFAQLATETTEAEARCKDTCADDRKGKNSLLLRLFSDPAVQAAVDRDLSWHEQHSLKQTMANIRQFEEEEVMGGPRMFLQMSSKRGIPGVGEQTEGCACAGKEVDCGAMSTLVGQMLECAKQKERDQEAIINKQKQDDVEELNYLNAGIDVVMENRAEKGLAANRYEITAGNIYGPRGKEWKLLSEYYMANKDRRFECYIKMFELENNHYCAIKALREFMMKATLAKLELSPDQVQDCDYGDFMQPVGECLFTDKARDELRGKEAICAGEDSDKPGITQMVNKGRLPLGNNVPFQRWERALISSQKPRNDQIEEMGLGIMGNKTIALECPDTKDLSLPCNMWMCPFHCDMGLWSDYKPCSASCDGGKETRSRKVLHQAKYGGDACEQTEEERTCNTEKCNRDCLLHNAYTETTGCLSACGTGRKELLRRKVFAVEKGTGTCPHKNADVRAMEADCPERECFDDEICNDQMDLVIVYECSASTTKLGCFFMATFVVALMDRMPSIAFGLETMRLALVRFGNGIPISNGDGTYEVADAVQVVTHDANTGLLTSDISDLVKPLYWHTSELFKQQAGAIAAKKQGKVAQQPWEKHWHLGFNNLGKALIKAQHILGTVDEKFQEAGQQQKVLVLTKGKQVQCTIAVTEAEKLKNKGVLIDALLFSSDYDTNKDQYAAVEGKMPEEPTQDPKDGVVSFPYHAHFHSAGPLYLFNSGSYRQSLAQQYIPHICPDAISPHEAGVHMCKNNAVVLHRGKTCPDWDKAVADHPMSLSECQRAVSGYGFQSFVWKDSASHYSVVPVFPVDEYSPPPKKGDEGGRASVEANLASAGFAAGGLSSGGSPNCFVHCKTGNLRDCNEENSNAMKNPYEEDGHTPSDKTCTYRLPVQKDLPNQDEITGWSNMEMSGVEQEEGHYYVAHSDCNQKYEEDFAFHWHSENVACEKPGCPERYPGSKLPFGNLNDKATRNQAGVATKTSKGVQTEKALL